MMDEASGKTNESAGSKKRLQKDCFMRAVPRVDSRPVVSNSLTNFVLALIMALLYITPGFGQQWSAASSTRSKMTAQFPDKLSSSRLQPTDHRTPEQPATASLGMLW
ncbi:MAG: hypothetical protein U0Z53_21305 [Blastocatellia bacterium]